MLYNQNSGYGKDFVLNALKSTAGKVFFVSSVTTGAIVDAVREIVKPDPDGTKRFHTSIDTAIGFCVANRGDKIIVLPGHTETISNATSLNLDVAGITIEGVGNGSLRPTITFDTATTTTIPVSANNITLKNLIFTANFADIVSVFTLTTAKNFTVDSCVVKATATNMNFKYVFDTNATTNDADGLTFINSSWIEPDSATISLCKVDGTNDSWNVSDNYISIATQSSGGGMFVIATGKLLTNLRCFRNKARLIGGDLSGAGVVFTTDGSANSGIFAENYIQHTDTTAEIFGTASSGFSFFENRMTGVAGATGYVLPAVDS